MVRVLVTVEPRMYREAIAIAVRRGRPEAEVMLVPPNLLGGQVDGFEPTCSLGATPTGRS